MRYANPPLPPESPPLPLLPPPVLPPPPPLLPPSFPPLDPGARWGEALYMTTVSLVVGGDISDITESERQIIVDTFATAAGVSRESVQLSLSVASVRIDVVITSVHPVATLVNFTMPQTVATIESLGLNVEVAPQMRQ
eukprot:861874-Prymnesium_polylepis.1